MVRDNSPILKGVVLSKADIQIYIDIGIDGFQREDYAGGVFGNLQPERIPKVERRALSRPQAEVGELSGVSVPRGGGGGGSGVEVSTSAGVVERRAGGRVVKMAPSNCSPITETC